MAQVKVFMVDRRTVSITLLAAIAVAGWGLFFKAYASRAGWREAAVREEAISAALRKEMQSGLRTDLDAGAGKLGELMMKIQNRQRELDALAAKETAATKRECGNAENPG
jgi:hypothetical protein